MLLRQSLILVCLSISGFAIEWEYKTENKDKTLSIMKEVNSLVNNQEVKKRYYLEPGGTCEPGYIEQGSYCEVKEQISYDVIGNVVVFDHADTLLNINVYNRKDVDGTDLLNRELISAQTVDLRAADVMRLAPFIAGGITCSEEVRTFSAYSSSLNEYTANFQNDGEREASNALFNYFIVDIPTNTSDVIDQSAQMREILETKFKCEPYGNIVADKTAIMDRISKEVDVRRLDSIAEEQSLITDGSQSKISTVGLSHIPAKVVDIQPNGTFVRTYFPDKLEKDATTGFSLTGGQEPSVIKFHPVRIDLAKTFYVPQGNISKNIFSTNYSTGLTELTTYETKYEGFPTNEQEYTDRVGSYVAYESLDMCRASMEGSTDAEKDLVIGKKNLKTKYNIIVSYGNILTEYNTKQPLELFSPQLLQDYVVGQYGLDSSTYAGFSEKIPYDLVVQRNIDNPSIPVQDITNKEDVYPKVLPVIQNIEKSSECGSIGSTYVLDKFAEAQLELTNEKTGVVEKTKYIGLVSIETVNALSTSTAENDNLITMLKGDFKNKIGQYGEQIENYINYDFERYSTSVGEVSLPAPIVIDFYKYQDDIFKQFIDGSTLEQLQFSRKIKYAPVMVSLKFHKCNGN